MGTGKRLVGAGIGGLLGSHIGIAVAGTAFSGLVPVAILGAAVAGLLGRTPRTPEQNEAIQARLREYRRLAREGKNGKNVPAKRLLQRPIMSPPEPISDVIEKPAVAVTAMAPSVQAQEPGFDAWRVPFKARHLDVGLHPKRGLFVMDPAGQVKLPKGSVRLYRAKTNTLVELAAVHLVELQRPKSEKQAYLAARGYAAFLNPSLQRPVALDNEPKAPCTPGCFDDSDTLSATYEPYSDSDDDAPSESDWRSMPAGYGRPNLAVSGEPYSEPYEELSSSFWAIDFENRQVGVAVDEKQKLYVLDPANQFGVPADSVRLYDVKADRDIRESKQFMRTLWRPRDGDRAELAVLGYSAHRNRLISRPPALDEDIEDQAGRVFELGSVWPVVVGIEKA